MLWNLLTAGIFGTDYYIKKKINTSEKKDLKEKCLGGRLIVRNCHNHGMMLGILKNLLVSYPSSAGISCPRIRIFGPPLP